MSEPIKRGDCVNVIDRQHYTRAGRVRRVEVIAGTRYYHISGFGVLYTDEDVVRIQEGD